MKITEHWLKVAYERVRDGEDEKEVLNDYGWLNVKDKISELLIDDRYGVYEIEYVERLKVDHEEHLNMHVKVAELLEKNERLRELLNECLGHIYSKSLFYTKLKKELEK
jgi:cell fate (sporulation/competence/biofilm development) regulator YlbF (YheA/YmcA/DUF963 family)